jgi:geranylgeranyl diphosphate synthase type II
MTSTFTSVLEPYKLAIENIIQQNIHQLGNKSALRDACEYALLNGGKRFRPSLVFILAEALNYQVDVSFAALGVEFFHTASLIVDDLPCMDNDQERRNQPTVHRVFGESTALLATYVLISAGYECLTKNAHALKQSAHPFAAQYEHLCFLAFENVTYNTGIWGATGGQFLDLFPPDLNLTNVQETIRKKTVSLFEISFVLGWLFGGGDPSQLEQVKKCSAHFGMAFQIADDLSDMLQDSAQKHTLNLANMYGKQKAKTIFYEEIQLFKNSMQNLSLQTNKLSLLLDFLVFQVEQLD